MKYLLIIPRVLWKFWFLLNFIITLVLFYPAFLVLLAREKWFQLAFRLMRFWAKWICYGSGIIPEAEFEPGAEKIPVPCVLVSNHCSYIDIPLSYVFISKYFVVIGKQELDRAPLFRIFFKRMNILVDRKSSVHSHKAYVRAGERIDKRENIFIFPEATISCNGTLMPFKNGAFKLAIDKQVPVVPLIFPDNWKLLQNGGFLTANGRPGRARVIIRKAVETKGMTNSDLISLREKIQSIILESLDKNK